MVKRINYKNAVDVYEFILRCKDVWEDFYLTKDKSRQMINKLSLIEKLLKYQEVFVVDDNGLKGIMIILKEKGFRPYIKLLVEKIDYASDLLKFLDWNYGNKELFIKIKKLNPICKILNFKNRFGLPIYGFTFCGDRGQEVLYIKKPKINQEKKNEQYIRKTP